MLFFLARTSSSKAYLANRRQNESLRFVVFMAYHHSISNRFSLLSLIGCNYWKQAVSFLCQSGRCISSNKEDLIDQNFCQ